MTLAEDHRGIRSCYLPDPSAFQGPIKLSLAAPAFNEAEGIRQVVRDWLDHLRQLDAIEEFEIVVCNDGSRDATGAILDSMAQEYPEVRPVHFATNQGAAAALTAAIAATRFDWILLIDSDGQFPITNLSTMLTELRRNQVPAAIGVRQKKDRLFARFGTNASAMVCNLLHGSSIRDFNSAFKLVWGPLLRALDFEAKGMNYSTEITSRLLESGVPIVEVAIEHRPRSAGQSHMKLFRGARDRFLFVTYIALRQMLLGSGVLRRPLS
ncbi:MAG TPA: glycosyltransferase family 2 protein [Candidatus Binataceae bacterium]|nr:glycosyltransferase family 2 protein [Candidatus Binataceae bacterium]